jgi:hypothetical protein
MPTRFLDSKTALYAWIAITTAFVIIIVCNVYILSVYVSTRNHEQSHSAEPQEHVAQPSLQPQ